MASTTGAHRSTPAHPSPITTADLDRWEVHLAEPEHTALWWVELAGNLDRLDDAFAAHRADVEGAGGWHAQVLHDAPRVAPLVARLEIDHDRLSNRIREARSRIGELAGDPAGAAEAIGLARDILERLRCHEEDARDLVHEAYRVDLGGE